MYETKTQEDDFHFIFQNGTVTMKDLSDLRKKLPKLVKKKSQIFHRKGPSGLFLIMQF